MTSNERWMLAEHLDVIVETERLDIENLDF